ncbi:hypothetical protein V2G26_018859 [Clonostachys chloroleuca]
MLETGLSDAKISSQRSYDTLRGRPVYSDMTEFLRTFPDQHITIWKKIETHHRGASNGELRWICLTRHVQVCLSSGQYDVISWLCLLQNYIQPSKISWWMLTQGIGKQRPYFPQSLRLDGHT